MKLKDQLVSLSAFLISLCAILISVLEVRVMNEQKEASVWPRVFVARNTSHDSFGIVVKNSGVGPAEIKYVEVLVDGKVKKDWLEVFTEIADNKERNVQQSTLTNNVLIPGQSLFPFAVKGDVANIFNNDIKRIRVTLCYCSIYEQCWVLDESIERLAGLAVPHSVDSCEIDIEKQFLK